MAKQLVNPIERHVEKAVLGLAGLVLLGVIAKFLVTSPNQIELGGESVTPSTIDEKVAKKAETVRQQLRAQQPKLPEFTPAAEMFARQMHPFTALALGDELPAALPIGPEVPFVDAVLLVRDKAKVVQVVPLARPKLTSGRMLANLEDGGRSREEPLDWVTVSSVFDRKAQSELQQKSYGVRWADVIFGPAELERRQRRTDGSWSDDDWVPISCYPVARIPSPPSVPLVDDGKQVTVRREDFATIEKFAESLAKPGEQLPCLRPMPPREASPTWTFPVLSSVRDVAMQDDEFLNPTEATPNSNPPLLRYPWLDPAAKSGARKPTDKETPAPEDPKKQLETAQRLLDEAEKDNRSEPAKAARQICEELLKNPEALNRGDADRAEKLRARAETILKDIKISGEGPARKEGGKAKREPLPQQQVWAHDARPGSLVNGQTYQYRIRAVILNRLLGMPEKLENPRSAAEVFLKGEWSEPSDPVTLEPASQFFISKSDEGKKEVTLEVFQWHRGVWVTSKEKFKAGDAVNWEDRVPIPDPENPGEAYAAKVRFSPGVTVVDVDFDRRIRERKAEKGGVKILGPDNTTAVIFMDAEGRLHERLESFDRGDSTKSALKARVWKAPKPAPEP